MLAERFTVVASDLVGHDRGGRLATWRERATRVEGRSLACGHFPAEEAPEETTGELLAFLTA